MLLLFFSGVVCPRRKPEAVRTKKSVYEMPACSEGPRDASASTLIRKEAVASAGPSGLGFVRCVSLGEPRGWDEYLWSRCVWRLSITWCLHHGYFWKMQHCGGFSGQHLGLIWDLAELKTQSSEARWVLCNRHCKIRFITKVYKGRIMHRAKQV